MHLKRLSNILIAGNWLKLGHHRICNLDFAITKSSAHVIKAHSGSLLVREIFFE